MAVPQATQQFFKSQIPDPIQTQPKSRIPGDPKLPSRKSQRVGNRIYGFEIWDFWGFRDGLEFGIWSLGFDELAILGLSL